MSTGANVPNPYNPFSDFGSWLGWEYANTNLGFKTMFGTPTPDDTQALGDQAAAQVAQAGGDAQQQQQAKALVISQIAPSVTNFDNNNPSSTIAQRAWDALFSGTGNPSDVLHVQAFDWPGAATAFDWGTIAILGAALLVLYYVVKEVF